ncbi:MAG: protein kinase [Gemmatimonadetes bacterium]|nr:protein kinase [Gemmatimonadota bacterium]
MDDRAAVSDALRDQLQQTLGSAYDIERELGGGGMSRVFVAEEARFRRRVVIKVLAPELAEGLSADRFEREIGLAAALQQANIVPVLTAGVAAHLPYYTMPFVDGESLRRRLEHGPLEIAEAISILRDVARALAYAHQRGVVHRDIKPDNVLLSGGAAVVTDFGIAKALSASRTNGGGATLTQLGTSIGTPAYMSPEQAAGDPATDHRADLYSFGCLGYELLAGKPPFNGLAPHKLLLAHVTERPVPVETLRPETPRALSHLLACCLEKDPALRPNDATEVLDALERSTAAASAVMTKPISFVAALGAWAGGAIVVAILARAAMLALGLPDWVFPGALVVVALLLPIIVVTWKRQLPWVRTIRWSASALGVFAAIVAAFMALRALGIGPVGSLLAAGKLGRSANVLVAEFAVPGSDSTLGRVVAEAVRTTLSESRVIQVVPASTVADALERMRRPSQTRLTADIAREVAQREAIPVVVSGDVAPIGGSYVLTVKLLDAATGDALASVQESAPDGNGLIPAIDRATRTLRGKMGESLKLVRAAPPLQRATTSSLAALREYTAAIEANSVLDYSSAMSHIKRAVELDSTFGRAYAAYAAVLRNMRANPRLQDSLVARAFSLRDRVSDRERLRIEAAYFRIGSGFDQTRALAAAESAVVLQPGEPGALVTLGINFKTDARYAQAESVFRRAVALGPTRPIAYVNLASALLDEQRWVAADSALRTYRALAKGDNDLALRLDIAGAYARGSVDSAALAARAASRARRPDVAEFGWEALVALDRLHGRIADAHRADEQLRAVQARLQIDRIPLADSLTVAMEDVWYRGDTRAAERRLTNALRVNPIERLALADRPYLTAARDYALVGNVNEARRWLTRYDAEVKDTLVRHRQHHDREVALASVALGEQRWDDALREADAATSEADSRARAFRAAQKYFWRGLIQAGAGRTDDAISSFEQYLTVTDEDRLVHDDAEHLAFILEKVGTLYEAKGNRAKAIDAYTRLMDLWKNADADLQPRVSELRRHIDRLRVKTG